MGRYRRLNYDDYIFLKDAYNHEYHLVNIDQGQLIFFEVYSDIGY